MEKLTVIDLFAGTGGLSCGLEMAGFECLLGIDFDKMAMKTFERNHPNAKTLVGDLREISSKTMKKLVGSRQIDVVCGGPPCQGFSTVGLGDVKDERNNLFLEFIRVVKTFNPSYIIMENVTGLLAKKNQQTLTAIIQSFENLGYHVSVKVLSAHHYGVPEKRRRTIFLCNRYGVENIFPEKLYKDGEADSAKLPMPHTVKWAFDNLIYSKGNTFNHDLDKAKIKNKLELDRICHIPEGGSVRYERDEKKYLPEDLWFGVCWETIAEKRFREAKLRRLSLNQCSPTINTSRTVYYHPLENRYLTVREAAAIQTFPADFEFFGTLTQQWKQVGNAVPPEMAKSIGRAVIKLHKEKESMPKVSKKTNIDEVRSIAFNYSQDVTKKSPAQLEFPLCN